VLNCVLLCVVWGRDLVSYSFLLSLNLLSDVLQPSCSQLLAIAFSKGYVDTYTNVFVDML